MRKSSEDEKIVSEMTRMLEGLDEEDRKVSKCTSCGSSVAPEDAFCTACGQQLRQRERPKVIVKRLTLT